jgi:hypothetical protein
MSGVFQFLHFYDGCYDDVQDVAEMFSAFFPAVCNECPGIFLARLFNVS